MRSVACFLLFFAVHSHAQNKEIAGKEWLSLPADAKQLLVYGYSKGVSTGAVIAVIEARKACEPDRPKQSMKDFYALPEKERKASIEEAISGKCSFLHPTQLPTRVEESVIGNHSVEKLVQQIDHFYTDPAYKETQKISWGHLVPLSARRLNGEDVTASLKLLAAITE